MRSVSAALLAAIQGRKTAPRLFVSLALSPTVRYNNGTQTYSWNSQSWLPRDFSLNGFRWSARGELEGTLVFQGVDRVFTAAFLADGVQGSAVTVYATNYLATFAADDVETLMVSEIDDIDVTSDSASLALRRQPRLAPNSYVNAESGYTFVDPPGTYHFPSGVVVVTRNDGHL